MSNVVPFTLRKPVQVDSGYIIHKMVNGELVECVNLDALTPTERARCFALGSFGASPRNHDDAPDA